MSTSKTKQLVLPFEVVSDIHNEEYLALVKQNWQITFSKQYLTSVYAKRVMGLIAAQIKEEGDIKEYYQISADKIVQETGLQKSEVYKRMKSVVYEMSNVVYFFEDDETGTVIPRHLLDTSRFENPAGYYNGKLTVAFNPQLKGIVNQLSHYSRFELERYVKFGSWYSMRLYELLAAFKDKDYVEWNIDKYRDWMGCGAKISKVDGKPIINKKTGKYSYIKYQKHTDAIKKTTQEPLKEFKGTSFEFTVMPIYEERVGRGRPAIEKVRFTFVRKRETNEKTIERWRAKSDKFEKVYQRLKKYKITDDVIVKHVPTIGEKELNKLCTEWDQRQAGSKNRIENIEHYCNKVIRLKSEEMQSKRKPEGKNLSV